MQLAYVLVQDKEDFHSGSQQDRNPQVQVCKGNKGLALVPCQRSQLGRLAINNDICTYISQTLYLRSPGLLFLLRSQAGVQLVLVQVPTTSTVIRSSAASLHLLLQFQLYKTLIH